MYPNPKQPKTQQKIIPKKKKEKQANYLGLAGWPQLAIKPRTKELAQNNPVMDN